MRINAELISGVGLGFEIVHGQDIDILEDAWYVVVDLLIVRLLFTIEKD